MQFEKSPLPQIVLDYVDLIISKMKYSRKARYDVRAELLAHFEDALRDVENEQDRQKRAEELIRDFGDAKLLAALIRRGKKRCRPRWQKAIIRTFQAACVLFLLLILYIGWFFTGKPVITTNYLERMNQLVRPAADDSQNAWPLYKEAVACLNVPDMNDFDLQPQKLSNLDGTQRRIIETWLTDNHKAMELVRQGNQRPYYWQVYSAGESQQHGVPVMVEVLLPNLQEYKKLAQLFCWDAYRNAEQGNTQEAMNDAMEVYNFGKHVRGQNTTLIEQLVGVAIKAYACKTIAGILSDYKTDSAAIASVQQKLETILEVDDFKVNFDGERLLLSDELQRCFTQSRTGKTHLYLQRLHELNFGFRDDFIGPRDGFRLLFTHPDQDETRKAGEKIYTQFDEIAKLTPATLHKRPEIQKQIEEIAQDNILLELLMPALARVVDISFRSQMYGRVTVALLAMHRFKLDTGRFPASLEDAVRQGYLKQVPTDVYSDEPIVYKQKDDKVILYSLGANFKDDQGQAGANSNGKYDFWARVDGDIVFWPAHEEK